jgi:diguanylate cyclase (GGDEF)-like protein
VFKDQSSNSQEAASVLGTRLTRTYLLALGLVVSSILLGGHFLDSALRQQAGDAVTLNTAGAQRMLSQRIASFTYTLQNNPSDQLALEELRQARERMQSGHSYLMEATADGVLRYQQTEELAQHYSVDGTNLKARVEQFLSLTALIIQAHEDGETPAIAALKTIEAEASKPLLRDLDRAVSLYEQASKAKVKRTNNMHRQSIVMALLVLAIEGFAVFRPLARQAAGKLQDYESTSTQRARLLSSAMKAARMGYWYHDVSKPGEMWISEELAEIYGFDGGQTCVPIDMLRTLTDGDDAQHVSNGIQKCRLTGAPQTIEARIKTNKGDKTDIFMDVFATTDDKGTVSAITGVVRDITSDVAARKEIEKTLELLNARTDSLSEAQALGKTAMWRMPLASKALELSAEAYALLGYDYSRKEEYLDRIDMADAADGGTHMRALCIGDSYDKLMDANRRAVTTGESQTVDLTVRRGDGGLADISIRIKRQHDAHGKPTALFGTIQDVSDQREAERQLEHLAYYDHLTGLANRALCTRKLKALCATAPQRGNTFALVLLDLDDFKEINDGLGHQAGDAFLCEVARRVSQIAGPRNLTARLGGDEFALLIETAQTREDVEEMVGQILQSIAIPVNVGTADAGGGASAGICMIPDDTTDPEEALRFADLALYEAKNAGRNRFICFDPWMSSRLQTRLGMSRDLKAAIGTPELQTHFQPIVSGISGKVTGFETLMRWNHPDKGWISPAAFIPVAESSHLIGDIGEFALKDACKQAARWAAKGSEFDVAVNVSAAQLWQGDLERMVDNALMESALQPERLCIELTESVFVGEAVDRIETILRRLKARGIKLALDDFGTGYSSLGYLNNLPFDKLKIDRCFVSGADVFEERFQLLEGIVGLARGLDMEIVAEGVETADELRAVQSLGVDGIQGFYFGKAQPADIAIATANKLHAKASAAMDAAAVRKEMGRMPLGRTATPDIIEKKVAS